MRLHPTIINAVLLGTTALLLAGCSGGTGNGQTNDADATAQSGHTVISLPVGKSFGESQWSVEVKAPTEQPPIVFSSHVVALSGHEVKAWGAEGNEAWKVPVPEGGDSGEVALRQIDANTVAVIVTGKTEGEGLSESGYAAQLTVINVPSGEATEVDVAGSNVDPPSLGKIGVAFILPDGTGVVVLPEGETVKVPDVATTTGPPDNTKIDNPLLTLGNTTIWATTKGGEEQTGYATDTWSTGNLDLLDYTRSSTIEAVAPALGIIVVAAYANDEHIYAAVDATTGETISQVDCKPSYLTPAVTSPNGAHSVVGPLRFSANKAQCVGGGEGKQNVTLTAVTDDGTAYGRASEGALVVAPANGGEPETSALPEGANPPIGLLEGGLAVHYDSEQGVITANPIQ